jgi:small-conductance mechanosensitive channel
MNWLPYSESPFFPDVVKSVILLAVVITARIIAVRAILRSEALSVETRRRWVLTVRNALVLIFVTGLIFIWFHELSAFAVSLVAIAVALVLATKELILCLSGTVLRAGTNAYTLGDRIEIGGTRGNVIDQNLLATTVLEIGPGQTSSQYTGRAVIFPNSLLLSSPVINETYTKDFIVHSIRIPLTVADDWQAAERLLLDIAKEECAPFIDEAQKHIKRLEDKAWLDAPSVQPRVSLQLPEPDRINLLLRIPSPAHRTSRLEQAILRRFLSAFHARRTKGHDEISQQ